MAEEMVDKNSSHQKNYAVRRYLEEGLVLLLPRGTMRAGVTRIFTLHGLYNDTRSLPWLLELLARFYNLDLKAVRRHSGKLLGLRHHIPLPLAAGLVLLPVKVDRETAGEGTTAYLNLLQVKDVSPCKTGSAFPSPKAVGDPVSSLSCICCGGGLNLYSLNTPATVHYKLRQGETLHEELLQRLKAASHPPVPFNGLDGEALRELLPACRCVLRNLLLLILDSSGGK